MFELAKLFHGLTSAELRKIAFQYGKMSVMKHNFNRNREEAGKYWLQLFLKRNPGISLMKPVGTINRIMAFNEESVKTFSINLENFMQKYNF